MHRLSATGLRMSLSFSNVIKMNLKPHQIVTFIRSPLSSSSQDHSSSPSPSSSSSSSSNADPVANVNKVALGKLLYNGNNEPIITGMFGMTWLNLFYWGYFITGNTGAIGQQYLGLDLGSPMVGYFGLACTVIIAASTRLFAHQHVYKVYESADGDNLIFQTHNLMGGGGRFILARPSRVRFVKHNSLSITSLPVKIDDMSMNFVLYQTSTFYDSNRLLAILEKSTEQVEKRQGIQKRTIKELLDEEPVDRVATLQNTPFDRKKR